MFVRSLIIVALASAWCARADETPRFAAARLDAAARVVRFEAPVAVDWQAAARMHFSRFDFEHLSAATLDHLRERIWEVSGDAEETFAFEPPQDVRAASYHLISAGGIAPLHVASFEGTIRFGFDHSKPPALEGISFFGEAVSQAGVDGGGFALLSFGAARPERIKGGKVSLVRAAGGVTLSYREGAMRASVTFPTKATWYDRFETAYALRLGARRYLFVRWPKDTDGFNLFCADTFSLYEIGKTLHEVAAAAYNCDV